MNKTTNIYPISMVNKCYLPFMRLNGNHKKYCYVLFSTKYTHVDLKLIIITLSIDQLKLLTIKSH